MEKNDHCYIISNTETFNKFLLTISSAAFPAIWYFIKENKGCILGFKLSLLLFGVSIFLTMLGLILASDHPEPKKCLKRFIDFVDWTAFILFSLGLGLTCYSIVLI